MDQTTIMVVEDETIIGMDIRNSLKKLGYSVPPVIATGEKAIEKAEQLQPNLILMDIMLKGSIDGVQAAEQIRKRFNLPIVYLTANTDPITLERAKETQPFGYIIKPFEEKDLHTTIEIALARCKAETEIRRSLEKEKELNELKSRFITMTSHEFRTPLTAILGSAELLEHYGNKWSHEKQLSYLHRIQNSVQHLVHLLDDVLLIGQAEAGKLDFHPLPLDLTEFCSSLVEELELSAGSQYTISFQALGESTPACMDEKLLRHILSNLLSNAVKYSPTGGIIEFDLAFEGKQARFEVKDRGIGIPPEDLQELFDLFYRAKNVGKISGTGLGLAIVKKAVDLHGGEISVTSEIGVGTSFTVQIPLNKEI